MAPGGGAGGNAEQDKLQDYGRLAKSGLKNIQDTSNEHK